MSFTSQTNILNWLISLEYRTVRRYRRKILGTTKNTDITQGILQYAEEMEVRAV